MCSALRFRKANSKPRPWHDIHFPKYPGALCKQGALEGCRPKSTKTNLQEEDDESFVTPSNKTTQSTYWKSLTGKHEHPVMDLTFANGREAYRSKKTSELLRALLIFNLCSVDALVDRQKELLKWTRRVLGRRLFIALMRQTFYGHFVAGADQDDIKPVVIRNQAFGVKSILDYSAEEDLSAEQATEAEMEGCVPVSVEVENPDAESGSRFRAHEEFADRREGVTSARTYFYEGEDQCDKNMQIFLNCIDSVSHATEKAGLAAIKLTALGKPHLLLQMSEVLATTKHFFHMLRKDEGEINEGQVRFQLENLDPRLKEIGVQLEEGGHRTWISVKDISKQG
ncbi:proline dehydrogenase 1, mitochondrial-like [Plakobranchus ocellatus]|uniref:Proline dehydrogenase n=1 Tax=Plakobranchus ocellatus TaxID=259542 RepID=A0AAV4AQY9_9GAST|nr:proline dehydrogenase 1, mitochondrial-like [Plakobranchus ocellatus]